MTNPEEPRLNGVVVSYRDDEIDESVRLALKGKSRVRYKCMDTFAHFLAFGTSSGAVYLYRLNVITHSACTLMSMIPCDQGSIEVIKFLPSHQPDDLLIAIGTSRGSLVVLRLFQAPREQNAYCDELYKAEYFTNNSSIKLIESDHEVLDTTATGSFSRLYICDSADRLYVLEANSIYSSKNGLRLFRNHQNHLPSLIFSVNDSRINQISVYKSHLLISTDETTRLFNEQSNQLNVIGKKKRKPGFYGACFFNPNYKPGGIGEQDRMQQPLSQRTSYSSLVSLTNEIDNLLIFVARPMFRVWQVNHRCEVMFTHQFEQLLKTYKFTQIVELDNVPLAENTIDDPTDVANCFDEQLIDGEELNEKESDVIISSKSNKILKSDHFHKLVPTYSSTLGNLLLSYGQHELFVIDPIRVEVVTWCSLKETIVQVCCNENEVFIWCQVIENERKMFYLRRLVLLAPTQFVLELHRIHRYMTMVMFVQQFSDIFRDKMALPLSGPNYITTEGGLLRNILLNAWEVVNQWRANGSEFEWLADLDTYCAEFKQLVEEILDESKQLKCSLDNLTDSRFFLAMANENIDRLLSEPYASLVSLEVSIAELHTNHVIHFSKEAINRHKSVANLSQDMRSAIYEAKSRTRSSMDLSNNDHNANNVPSKSMRDLTNSSMRAKMKAQVIVDRQRPKRAASRFTGGRFDKVTEDSVEDEVQQKQEEPPGLDQAPASTFFSVKAAQENSTSMGESAERETELADGNNCDDSTIGGASDQETEHNEAEDERKLALARCNNCQWPKARSHLEPLNTSQMIQLSWIEENLTTNFFENIDLIEERAFKYSLWNLFLKCLAFKRRIDDYITCCMLLDDVRLLDIEQLVIICSGEDEMIESLLNHLNHKMELQSRHCNEQNVKYCMKCEKSYEQPIEEAAKIDESIEVKLDTDPATTQPKDFGNNNHDKEEEDDAFRFSLANLFAQFIKRNNSNIKKMIGHFLKYKKLLNNSKLPISLYLQAIENTMNRSIRIKRSPILNSDSSFWETSTTKAS